MTHQPAPPPEASPAGEAVAPATGGADRPLHRYEPAELDPSQRALYEAIVNGPRGQGPLHFPLVDDRGRLEGPFNALLLQPALGDQLQKLGRALRYTSSLNDRWREMAILIVAATWNSEFERYAHEAIGRAAGLTEQELVALGHGGDADTEANWPDPDDLALVRVVRALAGSGDLDDGRYTDAVGRFGEAALFEFTTVVGYYATLALQLRVFRVATPPSPRAGTT